MSPKLLTLLLLCSVLTLDELLIDAYLKLGRSLVNAIKNAAFPQRTDFRDKAAGREGDGEMNRERSMQTYTLPYVK